MSHLLGNVASRHCPLMAARNAQSDTLWTGLELDVIAGVIWRREPGWRRRKCIQIFCGIIDTGYRKAIVLWAARGAYTARSAFQLIAVYFDIRSQRKKVEKA